MEAHEWLRLGTVACPRTQRVEATERMQGRVCGGCRTEREEG